MALVLEPTQENLHLLRSVLKSGGLVAIPTETVYGLAANAFDSKACKGIFSVKGRPTNDPLICHVASLDIAETIAYFNDLSRQLARLFWPGPLTLILPKVECIPSIVTAGLDTVGIRCPMHPVLQKLFSEINFPLAAPSANPFAYISPTTATHVAHNLGKQLDYILDGGPCKFGLESTIIDARDESSPKILRQGALGKKLIETKSGIRLNDSSAQVTKGPAIAPGSALKHYSPRSKLILGKDPLTANMNLDGKTAFLFWQKPEIERHPDIFWLSTNNSLEEAAARLYAALHEIDNLGYEKIITQVFPDQDIGCALNDRLRRAAAE